jgi:hypothetical protein
VRYPTLNLQVLGTAQSPAMISPTPHWVTSA